MSDVEYGVSVCWDETGAPKAGIIKRQTGFPSDSNDVIYSGPNFYVGNPFAKSPRPGCRSKGDFDDIDLTVLPERYLPRTNYVRVLDRSEYNQKMPLYDGKIVTDHYRVICRNFVNPSNERTLIPFFAPKGWAHVNSVIEYIFNDRVDMCKLTSTFGAWMSMPFDCFVRSMGKSNFTNSVARQLPLLPDNSLIAARALLLCSLTKDYEELWQKSWREDFKNDAWLSKDSHLTNWSSHFLQEDKWTWNVPLRTQLDRRQALLELDVIVTKSLGLSLNDLLLMYRVSFTTMMKYDQDTYYDQLGRCAFSTKKGESYLSRKEWEEIKDMKEGEFKKTITETVFSDTPTERTIVYKAPFFKKDREADYREAWEMLEKRNLIAKGG
jgi:hypothetical protein